MISLYQKTFFSAAIGRNLAGEMKMSEANHSKKTFERTN